MKEISLIVPCYNAIKYIDHFMEAVEVQTIGMDQLEVIFVDDASTDATFQKLCEWEQRYPESIMVIHCEKNGKLGCARNIGMGYATAEYIAFADIDDDMTLNMYEKLLLAAKEYKCDLVVCRSKRCMPDDPERNFMKRTKDKDWLFVVNNNDQQYALLEMDFNIAVWNKLYRKDILINNKLDFPEGLIYEDNYFTALLKHYICRIYVIEEELYRHYIWESSLSHSNSDWKKKLDYLFVEELKIIELKKRGIFDKWREYYESQFVLCYLTLLKSLITNYGFLSIELVQYLQIKVLKLFPGFMQFKLVLKLINNEKQDFLKIALEGFMQELTNEYMERLVYSVIPRE